MGQKFPKNLLKVEVSGIRTHRSGKTVHQTESFLTAYVIYLFIKYCGTDIFTGFLQMELHERYRWISGDFIQNVVTSHKPYKAD